MEVRQTDFHSSPQKSAHPWCALQGRDMAGGSHFHSRPYLAAPSSQVLDENRKDRAMKNLLSQTLAIANYTSDPRNEHFAGGTMLLPLPGGRFHFSVRRPDFPRSTLMPPPTCPCSVKFFDYSCAPSHPITCPLERLPISPASQHFRRKCLISPLSTTIRANHSGIPKSTFTPQLLPFTIFTPQIFGPFIP